jgi:hypothetical protein
MKTAYKIFLLLIGPVSLSIHSFAQVTYNSDSGRAKSVNLATTPAYHPKPVVKKPKPITTELSGGLRLNTNGWSFFMERGRVKPEDERHADMFYNVILWQFELSEIKNPKEYKTTNSNVDPNITSKPTPFIFGKINNFYTLKLGIGKRKMIAGKPEPGTVSVHWVYAGGLSVGMLKPYYIKVYNEPNPIKYSDATHDEFLSENGIIGAGGFMQGLHEIKFVPGLQAKTALHFDFAASRKTVLAVEFGVDAEIYTQNIPLMVNQTATPYFFNIFGSFQFGKRW